MIARLRNKLSYSNVVATLALFAALGGTAAAVTLPRHSVGPKQLKRGAVTAAALRRAAVTSPKLAPKSVIGGKLGPAAVGPGNIGNGAVTAAKLAKNSVTNAAIANGVVGTNKLGNGVVTTVKLANGAVTTAKLGDEVAPLLGTLRSGQTLRGFFDLGRGPKSAEGETLTDSYSFQFPLLNAPLGGPANIIDLTLSQPVTSSCPGITGGNQQTPEAAPGNLCVYITGTSNPAVTPLAMVNSPTRLGFGLKATAGVGLTGFEIVGQWAVTAP
jgi:hypothetical protein